MTYVYIIARDVASSKCLGGSTSLGPHLCDQDRAFYLKLSRFSEKTHTKYPSVILNS